MREPDITDEMLRGISVPTFVTAGEKDVIKLSHTQHIAETIPGRLMEVINSSTSARSAKIA